MAAGVGEASAVISVLQLGFNLATTLNTYIGDYQDAKDDISRLATEVDATLLQVEELNKLLEENKKTKGLSDYGVILAEKCRTDSEKVVKKLLKLLTKSGASLPTSNVIGPKDIDISKFSRATWPLLKPQVEVVKAELERTKIDILLARNCYQAQSAVSREERNVANARIPGLARSQKLARHSLHNAQMRRRQKSKTDKRKGRATSSISERRGRATRRYVDSSDESNVHSPTSGDDGSSELDSDAMSFTVFAEKVRDGIKDEIQNAIKSEDSKREDIENQEKLIRQTAVEDYKKSIREKMVESQGRAEELRKQLTQAFDISLPEDQIQTYIEHQLLREMEDDIAELMYKFTGAAEEQLPTRSQVSEGTHQIDPPQRPSRWFSRNDTPTKQASSSRTGSYRNGTPSSLFRNSSKQSSSGISDRYVCLAMSHDDDGWSCCEIHPHLVMGSTTKMIAKAEVRHSSKVNKTVRTWSSLPFGCRKAAEEWLIGNLDGWLWNLSYAEVTNRSSSKIRKTAQKALLGSAMNNIISSVLLVFVLDESDETPSLSTTKIGTHLRTSNGDPTSTRKESDGVDRERRKRLHLFGSTREQTKAVVDAGRSSLKSASGSVRQPAKSEEILPQWGEPSVAKRASKAPIEFKDAVGRNFTFPWEMCKTWKGIEKLIKQAFLHVDVIGEHVLGGHYDLTGPDGQIILPQVWESIVEPGWEVTMHMWPMPEPDQKGKKGRFATGESTLADPLGLGGLGDFGPFPPPPPPPLDKKSKKGDKYKTVAMQAAIPPPPDSNLPPGISLPGPLGMPGAFPGIFQMEEKKKKSSRKSKSKKSKPLEPSDAILATSVTSGAPGNSERRVFYMPEVPPKHDRSAGPSTHVSVEDSARSVNDDDDDSSQVSDDELRNKMLVMYTGGSAGVHGRAPDGYLNNEAPVVNESGDGGSEHKADVSSMNGESV